MKTDIEWLQEASEVGESSDWMSWPSVDPARIARVLQAHEAERQRADMANQQYLRVVSERDDATDELEELKDELADLKGEQVPVYQQLIYSEWHDCDEGDYRCADKDSRRVLFTHPQKPVVHPDAKRMDWLCAHCVEVRDPQMYGSHAMFHAQQDSEEWDLPHHTTLREQVDAAIEAAAGDISKDGEL